MQPFPTHASRFPTIPMHATAHLSLVRPDPESEIDASASAPTIRVTDSRTPSVSWQDEEVDELFGRFGGYEVKRRVATGGMGTVWAAEDTRLHRMVALKTLRGAVFSEPEARMRFRAEAEAAAALDHPNIVPIYEIGEVQGLPFFAMKLIEGESMADRLKRGPVPPREAVIIMAKIASAVDHAHQCGVLHRDLKPGNILIDRAGEPWLTDFGLAKFANADIALTASFEVVGTPQYMSPEQTLGKTTPVTTASDVWALGAILYHMLSGSLPFGGQSHIEIFRQLAESEPKPLSAMVQNCDRDLQTLCQRCMEKNPDRRISSAGELADELGRWLAGEPIRARRLTPLERTWKWIRRYPYRVAALSTVAISILAGSGTSFALWREAREANMSLTATNDRLEESLRLSTATRLASESRIQTDENPLVGVLLAMESMTTIQAPGEEPLNDSVSALMYALQNTGGLDATPSQGHPAGAGRSLSSRPVIQSQSPDNKWMLSLEQTPKGVVAALFSNSIPLSTEPRRRWLFAESEIPNLDKLTIEWLADSQQVLMFNVAAEEIAVWDVLGGLEQARPSATPSKRVLGGIGDDLSDVYTLGLIKDAAGSPSSLMCYEIVGGQRGILWHHLDALAEDSCIPAQRIAIPPLPDRYFGRAHRTTVAPNGRAVLFSDPWSTSEPILVQIHENGRQATSSLLDKLDSPIMSSAISADAHWLACGTVDGNIHLYDLTLGFPEGIKASRQVIHRRATTPHSLAISPDGRWLAASGGDSMVQLVNLEARDQPARNFRIAADRSEFCAFSPDSNWLAACSNDGAISVWATKGDGQMQQRTEFRGLTARAIHVSFSRDMRILNARSVNGECRRWQFNGNNPGAIPLNSAGSNHPIFETAVSPDGQWVAIGTAAPGHYDPTQPATPVRLFNVSEGLKEYALPGHRIPSGAAFSRDGKWFATTGRDAIIQVWSLPELTQAIENGQPAPEPLRFQTPPRQTKSGPVATRDNYERRLEFHPSGRLYATCGDGVLFEWDLTAPDPEATAQSEVIHTLLYLLPDIAVSPDGHWLAVARHGYDGKPLPGETQFGNMVLLFDVTDPDRRVLKYTLEAPFHHFGTVAFSADSRWLCASSDMGSPAIWDLNASDVPASKRVAPVAATAVRAVAFSPLSISDGPWLAMGSGDGRIHFWDWQRGAIAIRKVETKTAILSAAFLPDGRLVSGGVDGRLSLWETDPARLMQIAREVTRRQLTPSERARFGVER